MVSQTFYFQVDCFSFGMFIYERSAHTSPSSSATASQGLRRILLMTYFPSGFWSRLITRILADEQIIEAIRGSYVALQDVSGAHYFLIF